MNINIIVAKSKNNIIGIDNTIPWNIPSDLKHFKEITSNNVVIMGRKTFESLNNTPLPNRYNIVITSKKNIDVCLKNKINNIYFCNSFEKAITLGKLFKKDIFLIGGYSLYKEGLERECVDNIFVTEVSNFIDVNNKMDYAKFPKIPSNFILKELSSHYSENNFDYQYKKYKKIID